MAKQSHWQFGRTLLAVGVSLLIGSGCQLGAGGVVPSPLSFDQQRNKILEIVPLHTPRSEVEVRLKAVGIEGNFGVNDSVYYCDSWSQENGDRWQIDVALLFDDQGELYKTRPATAETRVTYDANEPATDQSARGGANTRSADSAGRSASGGSQPVSPTTAEDLNRSVMAPR